MATIPLEIVNGHAYVYAQIAINHRPLLPTLIFIVDTAASRSFICPFDESRLVSVRPELEGQFVHGVAHVHTMLGSAPAKSLSGHGNALELVFQDIAGEEVAKQVAYLYFADTRKCVIPYWMKSLASKRLRRIWDHAGQNLPHSILGCDVLNQFSMLTIPKASYGLLTNADRDQLIQQVEGQGSHIRGLTAFNEQRNFQDIWIREN